jgi:hypothetical protein
LVSMRHHKDYRYLPGPGRKRKAATRRFPVQNRGLPSRGDRIRTCDPFGDLVADKLGGRTVTLARLKALARPRMPRQPVRLRLASGARW